MRVVALIFFFWKVRCMTYVVNAITGVFLKALFQFKTFVPYIENT